MTEQQKENVSLKINELKNCLVGTCEEKRMVDKIAEKVRLSLSNITFHL
jgi:hypothetical protein